MEYKKATDLFPQSLLDQIYIFAEGYCVYFPKKQSNYKAWGSKTGSKRERIRRNEIIRADYESGVSIIALSQKYFISESSIKKIIYSK